MLLLLNQNNYKCRTTKWVWCVDFHREGVFIVVNGTSTDLERSVWHQVMAGQPSHGRLARWNGLHWLSLPTRASPPRVDVWQLRLRPNRLKPEPAGRPLGPLGLGSGPHVKYTPVVMMILTFGQLQFVIPWNDLIWFLSSWNPINTKIVELG
jgi:hypothetical protein